MCAPRASASTSSGWAYSRSIRSRTRRSSARSRRCWVSAEVRVTPQIVPCRPASAELRALALEQPPLRVVVDECERAAVRRACLLRTAQAAEQLGAGGVQVAVVVEAEAVDDLEARGRPRVLGDRDRAAQLADGRAGQAGELAVQRGDLRPVARLVGMERRDRGLQDVRAAAVQGEGAVERRAAG